MTEGLFIPGEGLYYRLDPRLKLVVTLVLMIALFSANSFVRPLLIFLAWLACSSLNAVKLRQLWKFVRLLRWLLIFTLLLHLLLTPGRALLGSSWVSYDGLLRGVLIDFQLIMAVGLSLALAWTTHPVQLAKGGASLLAPLQYLRVPVREIADLVPLVLYFIPSLQQEVERLKREEPEAGDAAHSLWDRWQLKLEILIGRMLDRGDQLARQIASGEDYLAGTLQDRPLVFDRTSALAAVGGLVFCAVLFMV